MIEVEVTYEPADYVRAIRFISRRPNRMFNSLMLICAIVFVFLLFTVDPFGFKWWINLAVIAALIIWYVLMRFIHRWNVGRQLRNAPSAQGAHVWVIGGDGIKISGTLSAGDFKWQAFSKVRESKDDFFFYTAPRFAHFLPKRSLAGEQEINSLRQLITETVRNKAKLR